MGTEVILLIVQLRLWLCSRAIDANEESFRIADVHSTILFKLGATELHS